MRTTTASCILLCFLFCFLFCFPSCAERRVQVNKQEKPDSLEIIINDRVIDFWDSEAMQNLIEKLPQNERAAALTAYLSTKERIVTLIIQREGNREGFWLSAAKEILSWAAAFGFGAAIKEEEEDDGDVPSRRRRWIELWYPSTVPDAPAAPAAPTGVRAVPL